MHQKDVSDQQLIKEYLSGDQPAFEALVKRHKNKIYTAIYLLVKDRDLAEDLFQETFIKVINTIRSGNYKDEGKFLPWATRIAHNLVIDHFRKQKRMPMVHETEEYPVFNYLMLTDQNVEEKMVKDQIHIELRNLIETLPLDQKEVLIMRHYGEMSFKEIADCTNVSINTSLGRMRYALINLRKLIKKKKLILIK